MLYLPTHIIDMIIFIIIPPVIINRTLILQILEATLYELNQCKDFLLSLHM